MKRKFLLITLLFCTISPMETGIDRKTLREMIRKIQILYQHQKRATPELPLLPEDSIQITRALDGTLHADAIIELDSLFFDRYVYVALRAHKNKNERTLSFDPLHIATSADIKPIEKTILCAVSGAALGTAFGLMVCFGVALCENK